MNLDNGVNGAIWSLVWLFLGIVVYFLPSILGRKKRVANSIWLTNLFFGWTIIGWLICLIWAASPDKAEKS